MSADEEDSANKISGGNNAFEEGMSRASGFLDKAFRSCAADPKGSVHRAWGISLIFVLLYFVMSVIEMINLQSVGGSSALMIAAIWTGIVHLVLGVLGTFVLKRFPTSFSVGFFLGILVVIANQNLILFGTFHGYGYGTAATNHVFGSLGFTLFAVLAFFAVLLFHFKKYIVVAAIDAKGIGRGSSRGESTNYQQYEEQA